MPTMNKAAVPLLAAVLLGLGCDADPSATQYDVRPGIIYIDVRGDARVVINGVRVADAAPFAGEVSSETPVVRAGVPFDVTVSTHTASCDEAGSSEVTVEGSTATVAVFDLIPLDVICNLAGTITPRTDRIAFEAPGAAEVVVVGTRSDRGVLEDRPYEIRFPVVVE